MDERNRRAARVRFVSVAVLAASALTVGLVVLTRRAAPPSPPPASSCDCDEVRRELAALKATVSTLRDKVALLQAAGVPATSTSASPNAERAAEAHAEPSHPRFVTFEKLDPSVTVSQDPDGTLTVVGSRPGMRGKRVTFVAITKDGEHREVTRVVE